MAGVTCGGGAKLDWTRRESVRADPSRNVRLLLAKDGYPVPGGSSRTDRDGNLSGFLKPDLTPPERGVERLAGVDLGCGVSSVRDYV